MHAKTKRLLGVLYFSFWISALFTKTAHAYIDPATTSYLFQIVAGLFIACGASIAIFWKKIVVWIKSVMLHLEELQIRKRAEKEEKRTKGK